MEQEKLKKMIKAMYLLKEILSKKSDDDRAFRIKPKKLVLGEVDEIIEMSLEDFYACRVN